MLVLQNSYSFTWMRILTGSYLVCIVDLQQSLARTHLFAHIHTFKCTYTHTLCCKHTSIFIHSWLKCGSGPDHLVRSHPNLRMFFSDVLGWFFRLDMGGTSHPSRYSSSPEAFLQHRGQTWSAAMWDTMEVFQHTYKYMICQRGAATGRAQFAFTPQATHHLC